MPSPKRRQRDERDGPLMARSTGRRLYLVFDDWSWGYSIHELRLSLSPGHQRRSRRPVDRRLPLPRPFIRMEAPRECPSFFSAVGTRIIATHHRNSFDDDSVPERFLPIVDVRSRGVTFGPGLLCPHLPIYLPVGDELFSLDTYAFSMLSLEPLWPPRLEHKCGSDIREWSWCELQKQPFNRLDVTSYAVHSDGQTILVSTSAAIFAFDTVARGWKLLVGGWPLPFTGRAHFVHALKAYVGLSKDPATLGHLCLCEEAAVTGGPHRWFLGREKLFSEDPAETHAGATLVYIGGSEFCLVEGVSIGDGNADQNLKESEEVPRRSSYCCRLTTFSLSLDNDGGLTTGGTYLVKCYKVPEETTETFFLADPVAFWL
ncbi:hypothetical protein BAE44_0024639 [Dichanthelium oligosanthes]|uniref:DUF295 domain-containing protein n=1 Tax=Dichanthelium oligosanthes TaxID=888268 RepID=A0A1E5UN98_9POAL|nr:hypothetical protein BAE44_0024639 [Dichanthelium oligosanthes]